MRSHSTSLRTRLALAFAAMVALILFVGGASYAIQRNVGARVMELRASPVIDLARVDLESVGLEIEGRWMASGKFLASDVEVLSSTSRPRLRGRVQSIDPATRSFTMYGIPILVKSSTNAGDSDGAPFDLGTLSVGQRVEVTCKVVEDEWSADAVYVHRVKNSDKIKGTPTAHELDGIAPETLEIHGLKIVLEPGGDRGPEGPLGRIEKATQLILRLREAQIAAEDLADGREHGLDPDGGRARPARERISGALDSIDGLIDEAEISDGGDIATHDVLRTVDKLRRARSRLVPYLDGLLAAGSANDAEARDAYQAFDREVREGVMPLAYALLSQAEDDLGDELRAVLDRTHGTTRIALWTSGVAVLLAFGLGMFVWRSIHGPIKVLCDAATRFGRGELDTRIELDRRDELGTLARAMNEMAAELSSTTVSRESLESVFDSMAASLVVADADARIVSVNRATLGMLGRTSQDLLGAPLTVLSPGLGATTTRAMTDRAYVRADGTTLPVSCSVSELRSGQGPVRGYVCVAQDVTEQKAVQRRLEESILEKEVLLQEVHHRVKNNMQVISSLLAMQSTDGDARIEARLAESQDRIRSIALIHEQLYRSESLSRIDVREYFMTLASQLVQSYGRATAVDLVLEVDDIELDLDEGISCGLIVNELVTNALKYAFGGRKGRLCIALSELADGTRRLMVADDGPGPSDGTPGARPTLGTSLVDGLARQLRGRVERSSQSGMRVEVLFPRTKAALPS